MADKEQEREHDDAPIGMADGKLIEASDDYDDEIDDDEEETEPPAKKTEDRIRRPVRRIIIHGA